MAVGALASLALATLAPGPLALRADDAKPDATGESPALSPEAFLEKVKTAMAPVKTTRGKFTQTKTLALFDDKVESSGTFAIARPDRLRWEVTTPFKSVLVIAGDHGARWNETRKAVERFALADKPGIDQAVRQLFTWYSGRFEDVKGPFDVTVEKDGRSVSLVPKNEKLKDVIARMSIKLARDLASLERIVLEEKGGDRTEIAFTGVEANPALEAKTFELEER